MEPKHIRIRVAGIVLNQKNELLLVNHRKNGRSYWLFPGGGVEHGEDIETALKREFYEELTAEIKKVGHLVLAHDTIYPDKSRHIINLYFFVELKKGCKIDVKPDAVLKNARFVSKTDFGKYMFYPDIKSDIISLWEKRFRESVGFIKVKWKK
ncbi:MAG: NUDIX hydrolase [Spirochaetia bacterium]|nr:NUDIX hydrolase [Spirochaetia bacterium]